MKSRKGGLYRPSSSSGTAHHATARATASAHHQASARRGAGRAAASAGRAPAAGARPAVATALTPPAQQQRDAGPRRGPPRRSPAAPRTSGSSTHGASAIGQRLDRGGAQHGDHPRRQRVGERRRAAGARGADPEQPGQPHDPQEGRARPARTHQARCTTQAGSPSQLPERRRTGPSGTGSRRPGSAPARRSRAAPTGAARGRGSPAGSTTRSSLVSGGDPAGLLLEHQRRPSSRARRPPAAQPLRDRRDARPRPRPAGHHRFRSTSTRFQAATSRRPGTRTTQCAHHGW